MNSDGKSALSETRDFSRCQQHLLRAPVHLFQRSAGRSDDLRALDEIAAATGTDVSGEIRIGGQLQQKVNRWGVGTDNRVDPNGSGDWTNADKDPNNMPRAVPLNEWLCVEWMHKGDTSETILVGSRQHPSLIVRADDQARRKPDPALLPAQVHRAVDRMARVPNERAEVGDVDRRGDRRQGTHRLRPLTQHQPFARFALAILPGRRRAQTE